MSIIGTTSRYRHYTIQITTLLLVILLFHTGITPAALAQDDNPLEKETQYFSSEKVDTLPDGRTIYKAVMAGPSSPPEGFAEETVNLEDPAVQAITIQLNEVPAFNWVFGCSAVSGAMIAGYYDRTSLPNVYTGPSNGGVIPLTSSMWGTWKDGAGINYPKNPLIASMIGLDGRAIKGSIEDYWISSGSLAADPYITGIWTQHAWGDAVGDYMKTSQSVYGNTDGATTFYYTDDGYPLNCDDTEAYGALEDGAVGYREFYEARGYDVGRCYTQLTDNQGIPGGFTYAQFKQQIDNGRPVMIHVQGHTMVGVGYSTTSNTIYIHDTWNYNTNAMPWGGYYYGMRMWGVTIVTPVLGNDSIHEPIEITGFPSTYSQNTTDDSHNSDEPDFTACGQEAPLASVWYTFTPVSDGEVYIDTLGSNYNTMLGIWSGTPGDLTLVGCNNDARGTTQSQLQLNFSAGQTYIIGIAQRGAETGGTLSLHLTTFADVAGNHPLWRYVEGFYTKGMTTGCAVNPFRYCPDQVVTRGQMAVFLLRALHVDDTVPYEPADVEPDIFADPPVAAFMEPWIEQFYVEGYTTGCAADPLMFCPEKGITRAEMAVFLLRAKHGSSYIPVDVEPDPFIDRPANVWMEPWIEQFYEQGYTTGCGGSVEGVDLKYCPERNAGRAEMATFIDRVFGFPIYP